MVYSYYNDTMYKDIIYYCDIYYLLLIINYLDKNNQSNTNILFFFRECFGLLNILFKNER